MDSTDASHELDVLMLSRIRILLADDHKAMQERVRALLEPDFDLVAVVDEGKSLVDAARKLNPDVLIVDISMPVLNGLDAVRQIVRSGGEAKVIFLTVHNDPQMVPLCFYVGAQGFVVKSRLASDLIPAIKDVTSNRTFVSPTLASESSL